MRKWCFWLVISKVCDTTLDGVFRNLWGILIFLQWRRRGNTTGGYHNARLSPQMRHSQRMKTYVTHKYWMSNQTLMCIFKNPIYNYLSINVKNIHSIIFFHTIMFLYPIIFFCKLLYKLNFPRMKSLNKSSENLAFSPYQKFLVILKNHIVEGNVTAKYQYQTSLEFHCGCRHTDKYQISLSNFLV